jgi:signal transduction histidine kinase
MLLQSVFDSVPDLLIVIDRNFRILLTNAKGHDLILQPDPEKCLTCYGRFKLLDAPCEDCSALTVFETGQTVERKMVNPADGRVREVRAFPIRNAGGDVQYVVEYVRDITDRKQTEEALKEANRKLHLLSSITRHDILNKVSVLLLNLAHAKTKSQDPTMAVYIAKLESAAMAIKEQIEFTRVYQDLGSHEPHWHNLDHVISRLQIPLSLSVHADLPHVEIFADPILKKVFYNLLDNAVRHGQKVSTITVSAREGPHGLVISWQDDGVGIPAQEKEKIFSQDYGKHTGLGLFLAAEICSVTGITLKETGEPGTGARFEMLVPPGSYRFTGRRKKNLQKKAG